MAALALLATSALALLGPLAPDVARPAVRGGAMRHADDAAALGRRSSRRDLLAGGVAALGSLAALPAPVHASYALYQSSYDSFQDRKTTGYVPVATSDRATLAAIQGDIRKKRPPSPYKPEKAPQYCAGMTGNVTPMYENICSNIGVSKADQSNTMADACARLAPRPAPHTGRMDGWTAALQTRGRTLHAPRLPRKPLPTRPVCARRPAVGNMNIGSYTSASGAERKAAEARLANVQMAAEAARLRQLANSQNSR